MMQKLIQKADVARLAGVNASTVTRLCKSILRPAFDGELIDANHPVVIEYLQKRNATPPEPAATGLDPLYEDAVVFAQNLGRISTRSLQEGLKVGRRRADTLANQLRAAKILDSDVKPARPAHNVSTPSNTATPPRREAPPAPPPQAPPPKHEDPLRMPEDIQTMAHLPLIELVDIFGTDVRFEKWLNSIQKIEGINEKRLKNAETQGKLISRALVKGAIIDVIDGVFTRILTDGRQTISARAHAVAASGGSLEDVDSEVSDLLGSFIKPAKQKMAKALKEARK